MVTSVPFGPQQHDKHAIDKADVVLQSSLACVRAHNLTKMTNAEQIQAFSGWFTLLWGWRGALSRLFAEKVTGNLCVTHLLMLPHTWQGARIFVSCDILNCIPHSFDLRFLSGFFLASLRLVVCHALAVSHVCFVVCSPTSHYLDFLVRNRCFLFLLLWWFSCYQPHYQCMTSICVIILCSDRNEHCVLIQ